MAALEADQKKKLYILLGLAGLLGIVGIAVLQPWNSGGGDDVTGDAVSTSTTGGAAPVAPSAPAVPASPGAADPMSPGAGTATRVATATTINSRQQVAPESVREDPFAPEVVWPTPTPYIPPPPTPRPPVILPQPPGLSPIPLPSTVAGAGGASASGRLLARSPLLVGLPPISITRMVNPATVPSSLPPRTPGQGGGLAAIPPSPNKRIAGVVLGDTVRALIEISDGEQVVTRVVQPGDEVEGIRILRIERVREGDRLVTRMIVREDNEERRIDLRPAPQGTGTGGEGGSGGYPGSGGGYPGSGGGGGYPGSRGGFRPPRPPTSD